MYVKQLIQSTLNDQPVLSVESLDGLHVELLEEGFLLNQQLEAVTSLESLVDTCDAILAKVDADPEYGIESRTMVKMGTLQLAQATGINPSGVSMESDSDTVSLEGFKEVAAKVVEVLKNVISKVSTMVVDFFKRIISSHEAIKQKVKALETKITGLAGSPSSAKLKVPGGLAKRLSVDGKFEYSALAVGLGRLSNLGDFMYGEYSDSVIKTLESAISAKDTFGKNELTTGFSDAQREVSVHAEKPLPGGSEMNQVDLTEAMISFKSSSADKMGDVEVSSMSKSDMSRLLSVVLGISEMILRKKDVIKKFNASRAKMLSKLKGAGAGIGEAYELGLVSGATRRMHEKALAEYSMIAFDVAKAIVNLVESNVELFEKA